ncbi:MAG: sigma 54-interacting transcriptional regulator, partial [Firmicutes bacterium]|nr:sigma 54-interacting transcriptional regulator [Bacillota bacterium]
TSTLPIMESNRLIGTIDVSSYNSETFAVSDEYIKKEKELYTLDDMVTLSESMVDLKEKIQKISNTDSSVMIYGETGTGKELVAQSIHTSGKRKGKPFIAQNCSAIPASLLESILFGTTKGSFTGAEYRKGLFELADGGTLFLDEINSMELSVQGKLLKAIEEKQFTRVGGSKPIHVDVKIISATNEKLEDSVARGVIRQDLLYRLSVVRLNIPPLRERMIDIGPLVQHFINLFNYRMDRQVTRLEDGVYDLFNGYNWPGNVRELRSAIESGFNISSGRVIRMKDLPEYLVNSLQNSNADKYEVDYTRSLKDMVEDYERHIIEKVLAESSSKVEAATKLKTTKQVFNYKLKKYNIE